MPRCGSYTTPTPIWWTIKSWILERSRKHFDIVIKGKRDTISLDRLKPAHLNNNTDLETNITPSAAPPATTESQSTTPTRVTRSGQVQYPVRYFKWSWSFTRPVHWRGSTVVAHECHVTITWLLARELINFIIQLSFVHIECTVVAVHRILL